HSRRVPADSCAFLSSRWTEFRRERKREKTTLMPSFLLLFRDDTARGDPSSRPDQAALYERFVTWADKLHQEKRLLGVERLEDAARLARDCPGLDDACAVEVRRVAPFPKPS